MNREIYTVYATQIVTSETHPEGAKSNVAGYPKDFDSRDYEPTTENPNGNQEIALIAARADFWAQVRTLRTANNPKRVMWTVKLERADGREIEREPYGAMPDMTPPPPPETQITEQNQNQGEGE